MTSVQLLSCRLERLEFEFEALAQKATGNDSSALQNKFRLGPEEERAEFQHPAAGRKSNRHSKGPPKDAHHLGIRKGMRSAEVVNARGILLLNEPFDRAAEIRLMNPGNKLLAGGLFAA